MNQQKKLNEIRFRRLLTQNAGKRLAKKAKALPMRFPSAIAIEYARTLTNLVTEIAEVTRELVFPKLGLFVRQDSKAEDDIDAFIKANPFKWQGSLGSNVTENIDRVIDNVRLVIGERFTDKRLRTIATTYARSVDNFNAKELETIFQRTLGIPVGSVKGLADHLDVFTNQNVKLIKSLPERILEEIEGVINRGYRMGRRTEDMAQEIEERFSVGKSRAQLIARDQTNKLYGEVTKMRQTATGVTRYTWRTSRDERVRDSHAILEGNVYSWDSPPAVGHPGEDIRCRCTAEPLIQDILDALGD